MELIGNYTPSQFLPPNPALRVNTRTTDGYLRVFNKSPYLISMNMSGLGEVQIPEFFLQDFPISNGYTGNLVITPTADLTNVGHAPANLLTLSILEQGEIDSPQFLSIPHDTVTATASGKPLFSCTVGFGATVGVVQIVNVFNPINSGVNMTFHSARVFTNDGTNPTANLIYVAGGDLSLPIAVPVVYHSGVPSNVPVSLAHATARDYGGGGLPAFSYVEVMNVNNQDITQDFLDFPDYVTLAPGGNLLIYLSSATNGHVVRFTAKWVEDIFVPAQGGLINSVATSLINEGNPLMNIVQATLLGDSPEDITIDNSGLISTVQGLVAGNHPPTLNGGIAGTADMYQIFVGSFKYTIIATNGFRTGGAAQSISFPVPYTKGANIRSTSSDLFSLQASGIDVATITITALPAGAGLAGTVVGSTTMNANGLYETVNPFDRIQFKSGWASNHSGYYIIEGV